MKRLVRLLALLAVCLFPFGQSAFAGDFNYGSTSSLNLVIKDNNGKQLKTISSKSTDRSLSGTGLTGTVTDGGDHWIVNVTGGILYGTIYTGTGLEIRLVGGSQAAISTTRGANAISGGGGVRICGPGMLHIDQHSKYPAIVGGRGSIAFTLGAVVGINGLGGATPVKGNDIRVLASALHVNAADANGIDCDGSLSIGESIVTVCATKAAVYQSEGDGDISVTASCVHLVSSKATALQCGDDISAGAKNISVANSVFCALGAGHGLQGTLMAGGSSLLFDNVVGVVAGKNCGIYAAKEIFVDGGSTKLSIAGNITGNHTPGDTTAVDYLSGNNSSGQGIRPISPSRGYFGVEAGNVKLFSPGVCALDCGTNAVTGGKLEIPGKATYGDFQTLFTWQGAISAAEIFMGRSLFESDLIYSDFDIAQAFTGILAPSAALFYLSDAKARTGISADMLYVTGGEVSVEASGVGIHLGGCYASHGAYLTQKGGRISVEAGRVAIADDDAVDGAVSSTAKDSGIWLTGGKLKARGGWDGILTCGYVLQEGGTLEAAATGGYTAGPVSSKPGLRGYALSANNGFAIDGGSFVATAGTVRTAPNTSSAHNFAKVYPCDLSVSGTGAVSVSGMVPSWYGVNDLYPVGGKVRFWLPVGSASLKYGGVQYTANGTGKVVAGSNVFRTGSAPATTTLTLAASSRSFTASAAGSKELGVTANVAWTAKSSASWLAVKTASGSGNGKIVYNVAANPGTGSRTATITVTGGGLTRTFTVTQSGKTGGGGTAAVLTLAAGSRSFTPAAANSKELGVTANVAWTAKSSASWLAVKTASGSGNGKIVYNVAANSGSASRTATITVTGGGLVRTFTVTQGGNQAVSCVQLWADGPYWADRNIGADNPWDYGFHFWWGDTVGYRYEGDAWVASDGSRSNFSFNHANALTYDMSYSVLRSTGWITAEGVLAPAHDAAQVHWGGGWRMPTDLELSGLTNCCDWASTEMNGVKGIVIRGRGSYAGNSIFIPAAGIASTTVWRYAGFDCGIHGSVPNPSDSCLAWGFNYGIDIYCVGTGYRYYGVSIRPVRGSNPGGTAATLALSASSRSFTAAAASSKELGVTGNVAWTAKSSASWLAVKKASGSGKGKITYNVAANTGTGARAATITVTGGGLTRTFAVSQSGKTGGSGAAASLTLGASSRSFTAAAVNSKELAVTANVSWTAKSDASWLVVKTAGGSGNGKIVYNVAANSGSAPRAATITVTGGGLARTFAVSQSGKTGGGGTAATLTLGASSRSFAATAANNKELAVTANVSWTAKSSASWLAVKTAGGTGNGKIVYNVAANTGTGARTAKITVAGGGVTRMFTVTQQGAVKWQYTVENGKATVSGAEPAEGDLVIPATLGGFPVTSIDTYAFENCSNLTGLVISGGVTNIQGRAFENCSRLATVSIPASLVDIADWTFIGCSSLKSYSVASGNPAYKAESGLVLTKDGRTLVRGVNGPVVIPGSVTAIGESAFDNFSGLTSVSIPSGVTNIGAYAFYGCSALSSLAIPANVKSIGDYALHGCSGLGSVAIPASVTDIGVGAFGSPSLQSMSVAGGNPAYKAVSGLLLTKDGTTLVQGVNGNAVIPGTVKSIQDYAFYGCTGLTGVTIPGSVTSIGWDAFNGCSGLTGVAIPGSVTNIEVQAFFGCDGLTSVTIPASVTYVGASAFGCRSLRSISVASGNPVYKAVSGLLLTKDGTTLVQGVNGNVVIPASVTYIGTGAFFGCRGLTGVTVPNGVRTIGQQAFHGCTGLTSMTIPDSVTLVGGWAFYECSGLATLYVPANWEGSTLLASARVPEGCRVVYGSSRGVAGRELRRLGPGMADAPVSVTTSDGGNGETVLDGDEGTGWGPVGEGGGWVVLSYPEAIVVKGVSVKGEGLPEDGVRVLLSEDADDWQEGTEGRAQYVWVVVPEEAAGATLTEIEVEEK